MKKLLQAFTVLTLLVWGVLFLYFYTSGRIEKYLDPSFRIYALISGIGFILLGAFNFLNRNRATGLCTHDHTHGDACDHPHHHAHEEDAEQAPSHRACEHDHGPSHSHVPGETCDHDHSHDHGPSHSHGPGETCDHDHSHDHGHSHSHAHGETCGHDHSHDHEHSHSHAHGKSGDHTHGGCCGHEHDEEPILAHSHTHDESPSGVVFSLLVLLVPLLVASAYSHDRFSSNYLAKWGKIERQMMQMRIAARSGSDAKDPVGNPYTREGIEGTTTGSNTTPTEADTPPDGETKEGENWGSFTLEDLKKMVPQNDKGEFLLDVPQIFYTAGDKELMQVMEGIPVETTAQLMEETLHNPDKTRLKAFRLFIECCAADARPLSIPIDFGQAPPPYKEMGWYKIYGKLHYSREQEEIIPLLQIERIEETTEPNDGLLF